MAMAPFDEITAIYTSFHAWTYETIVAPAVYLSRHLIDDRFLQHLPQDARVLDVGCGGAKFTKYIADQRPDVHIVGIDLSKPQIARAAKLMRGHGDRVRFDIVGHRRGPQRDLRRLSEPDRQLRDSALPRWPEPRVLPHLDRGTFARPGRRA